MEKKDRMRKFTFQYVISVLVADRVGILRDITAALTDMGSNIVGISQTVVQGYFTVIIIAAFQKAQSREEIENAIGRHLHDSDPSVLVRKFEGAEPRPATGGRYILTMSGRDRPGILKAVTAFLAEKGINVEDLFFRIDGENVTHIGELTIPRQLDIKQCQEELQALLAPLGLTGGLQHENLFRVTNEVGAIQTLIRENGNA